MHYAAYYALEAMINRYTDPHGHYRVLDMGGLDVNSTKYGLDIRKFLPNATWKVLDVVDAPGVDFVADARSWTPPELFDVVVSTEMLEHLEDWYGAIETMAFCLDHGGPQQVFITAASDGRPPHDAYGAPTPPPEGQWYENISPDVLESDLRYLFKSVEVEYNAEAGDVYAYARGVR